MTESNSFRNSVLGARNHRERALEGKALLAKGRPLSEMTTPAMGMTDEENGERRDQFIALIRGMTKPELEKRLDLINNQIEQRLQREEKGTSELEWQRIMVGDELESR